MQSGNFILAFTKNRHLINQMIKRDIAQRYRGSWLGLLWSFINPLLMLSVYSFVFSVVFKAKWGGNSAQPQHLGEYALILYCGLLIHSLFAECLSRAPTIILNNASFVKKVVFPLEILPIMLLGTAIFHYLMGLFVLLFGILIIYGSLPITALFLPIILFPLCIFMLGMAWILASLGVFLRDIGQMIGLVMTILLFLSPVFYTVDSLPQKFQKIIYLNPLSLIVEQVRLVLLFGKMPNFYALGIYMFLAFFTLVFGFWWFQKTRKAFADVI